MDCFGSPTSVSLPFSSSISSQRSACGWRSQRNQDNLRLKRIGILKFIDQDVIEHLLETRRVRRGL